MAFMIKILVALTASFLAAGFAFATARAESGATWQSRLEQILPLLGHRNWILIVDSAYPLQTSPGIETLETSAGQMEVIHAVLGELDHSMHVRPIIYTDAELPQVPEQDAPGITAYRKALRGILAGRSTQSMPHEQIIGKIDEAGKTFHVVVLKTTMTVPYTSVFLQLECKYWSEEAEQQLRQARSHGAKTRT